MTTSTDDYGIVVIGRNEGPRLIECLASIKRHTGKVVYVDSGSRDGSVEAAQNLGIFVVKLDAMLPFTAARARNEGFAAVKQMNPRARYVQFIDGDCILACGWLESALSFLEQRGDVAVVCGRRRERYMGASIYNTLADIEWDTPVGETIACGGDALMRSEAFDAVGGYRPTLVAGEEPELCIRLREAGWKIWRLDADMTWHDMAMSRFSQWFARMARSGYGMTEVWWLHRRSPKSIWARETASMVVWATLLPIIIILGAMVRPAFFTLAIIYPLQVARIALKRPSGSAKPVAYALFVTIGKFAAFQGLLRLFWTSLSGRAIRLIEYK